MPNFNGKKQMNRKKQQKMYTNIYRYRKIHICHTQKSHNSITLETVIYEKKLSVKLKKCTGKALQDKTISRNSTEFVLCLPSTDGHGACHYVWFAYLLRHSWKESIFLCVN